jgi:hypothetical protein|tara:strand:- start:222 stop:509 length:288 start_codon:yes stop_codon:yes gene_type:complete
MSDVQEAIEELVNAQVDSRIEDAIYESSELQDLKYRLDDVEDKMNGDFADQIINKVIIRLMQNVLNSNENLGHVIVKQDYLDELVRIRDKKGEEK